MRRETARRLAGGAAVLGGLIDLAGPLFYPRLAEPARQAVYVLIDLLLLLGLIGVRSATGRSTGWLGLAGFVVAVAGVLLVRSSAALGPNAYPIAAGVWSIGMAAIGAALLMARGAFRAAAMLWIAALVIGLAGLILKDQGLAHRLAATAFALGFLAAGASLVRAGPTLSGDPS